MRLVLNLGILLIVSLFFVVVVYGNGVYFVLDVFYLERFIYLLLDVNGFWCMYFIRVLVGEYIKGR